MNAFDIAIVGAGPAGLAAARAAARSGKSVAVIDDNPEAGGQIWRGAAQIPLAAGARLFAMTRVFDVRPGFEVHMAPHGVIRAERLILATGARELFLPFPGWTEAGVAGAGALQTLVKSGMDVRGRRVLVAGSGPLLVAVAASLRAKGARVLGVAEQAPLGRIVPFLLRYAAKLPQATALRARLFGVPYWTGVWPVSFAAGRVALSNGRELDVDFLACGFGLVPNSEAAQLLGCRVEDGFVVVDSRQETTVRGVYCAGEPTGIGGLEKALEEGERAGAAATGQAVRPGRTGAFVRDLARAFALDGRLYGLARPETLICRCEEVPLAELAMHREWREAKLQTRCGMGACQGRICGPVAARLFGWTACSVRPPLVPVAAEWLATGQRQQEPGSDR